MQIKKVQIENFRSINEKITVNSNDSNFLVFIGSNNSGKSNILRAINLFFNEQIEPNISFNPEKDLHVNNSTSVGKTYIELQFTKEQDKVITSFIDKHYPGEFTNYLVPIAQTFSQKGIKQYTFTVSRGQKKNLPDLFNKIEEYVNCIYIPAIKDYKNIINSEMMKKIVAATFHSWGRGIRTTTQLSEQKHRFLKVLGELQGILDHTGKNMTTLMSSVLPSIKKFNFLLPYDNLEEFLGKLIFEIQEEGLDSNISLDSEGSGIQSFTIYSMLKILHELHPKSTYKKSQLLWLIEEPETFMHHDLQRKTFSKLKEYSKEGPIMISTHSPVFIDKESYNNTYLVTKASPTKIERLTPKTIREVLSGHLGISFQDFFLFNKFNILVEGETDKALLLGINKLIKAKSAGIHLNTDEVEFISCGSANAIPHFYCMYNSFNQYADFIALFDRDKSGTQGRTDLLDKGIDKTRLLLIPASKFKTESAIEDMVDKSIWDDCLRKLDSEGLVTIKSTKGKIIDYEYQPKNRVPVKKLFTSYLLSQAKKDLRPFQNYIDLIGQIHVLCTSLSQK